MALRGIAREPGAFVEKAWRNLLHLIRPDGLQLLFVVEEPMPAWRHAALIVLDDLIVLPAVVLFTVFLIAGRSFPDAGTDRHLDRLLPADGGRHLPQRDPLSQHAPALRAGGSGGGMGRCSRDAKGSRGRVRLALALGLGLVAMVVAPYAVPAGRALRGLPALRAMREAVEKGDTASARRHLDEATPGRPHVRAALAPLRTGAGWSR